MDWNLRPTWAQGVAGSNPVAPTKSLSNPHNPNEQRDLARSSAPLTFYPPSPRIAGLHLKAATKAATPKSQLSDANVGACRRPAAKSGHTRALGATMHDSKRVAERARVARGSCRRTAPPVLGAKSTCHVRGACGAGGAAPSGATRELGPPITAPPRRRFAHPKRNSVRTWCPA